MLKLVALEKITNPILQLQKKQKTSDGFTKLILDEFADVTLIENQFCKNPLNFYK